MLKNYKKSTKTTGSTATRLIPAEYGHFLSDPRMTRLLSIFGGNLYRWIHAPNSYRTGEDGKPDYTTVKGHPIEPRALGDLYHDPAELVGLRFGSATRWAGFDIDAGSTLNPLAPDPTLHGDAATRRRLADVNLTRLKDAAERYGLIAPVCWQSSFSGGLWIGWAFPKKLRTIEVATLLRAIAVEAGFPLRCGQLEAFPNTKAYKRTKDRKKFTQFRAFRLPMQPETGALLLDDDLEPVADDVGTLLDHLEFTATKIDIEDVRRFCKLAYADHLQRIGTRWQSKNNKRAKWIAELERITSLGFTGHHQTNDLLGKIATLGVVRDGLNGMELATFIEETAVVLPGYTLHCRHQHEIDDRSREWAASAEAFYWHINDPLKIRSGSYRDMHERAGSGTHESKAAAYHQRRSNDALEALRTALEALQGCAMPTLSAVFQAACEKARELFGRACSKRTWVKYREQLAALINPLIQPTAVATETVEIQPAPSTLEEDITAPGLMIQPPVIDPPKIAETQAQSQCTPCLQTIAEITPAEIAETQAQSQCTPCSPIMKVFEWASSSPAAVFKSELLAFFSTSASFRFIGDHAHGLVELADKSRRGFNRKVHSLTHGVRVELLEEIHSSWLVDNPQELLVYTRPQGSGWCSGVLVPLRSLHPLLE